ncbi:hypothetical protein T492DRAFT_1035564 [Pavlovales sp. CCMP2436]|nr:hypothetical protein T492DRAFT_1035564 [Pavlovales sp. CCMP2436]
MSWVRCCQPRCRGRRCGCPPLTAASAPSPPRSSATSSCPTSAAAATCSDRGRARRPTPTRQVTRSSCTTCRARTSSSRAFPGALIRLQSGVFKVVTYELSQALNKEQLVAYQRTVDAGLHVQLKVRASGAVDLVGSVSLLIDEQTGACLRCDLPVHHAGGRAHAHRTSDAPTAACVECAPGVAVLSCLLSSLKLCAFRS